MSTICTRPCPLIRKWIKYWTVLFATEMNCSICSTWSSPHASQRTIETNSLNADCWCCGQTLPNIGQFHHLVALYPNLFAFQSIVSHLFCQVLKCRTGQRTRVANRTLCWSTTNLPLPTHIATRKHNFGFTICHPLLVHRILLQWFCSQVMVWLAKLVGTRRITMSTIPRLCPGCAHLLGRWRPCLLCCFYSSSFWLVFWFIKEESKRSLPMWLVDHDKPQPNLWHEP